MDLAMVTGVHIEMHVTIIFYVFFKYPNNK